jgi:Icc-related predicted phosphoesterase
MRCIIISDTHNGHRKLEVPPGDLLIHCGDMTNGGSAPELRQVNEWLGTLPHPHKVVIAGALNPLAEPCTPHAAGAGNMDKRLQGKSHTVKQSFLSNGIYLEDQSIEIEGVRIFGSPYTPAFCGQFQLNTRAEAEAKWDQIPQSIDILVTHGPPLGVLDLTSSGMQVGDAALRERVRELQPKVHCFGHIHECGGQIVEEEGTKFVNAAQHVVVVDL